ncbi:MAG: cation:proton antiporter [Thermoleophilaceae bacterium]|nr:cation:proton antiporter [Thermoleophilaceae bacterium]
MIAAGTMEALEQPLAILGLLLVVGAIVSGVAKRSFLSLTALFVLAGFALGEGGLEVLDFDPRGGFVEALAVVALIVILFRDGLEVEAEMLQKAWHLPFRKLVLAMPITGALVACAAKLLTDLSWTEAFLLGALLSPTDPVLSSSVVTNPRVPRIVRHSLNLESGMNDGLALPAVLALLAALSAEDDFVWWQFVLQDVSLGLLTGAVVGAVGSRLLPRSSALGEEISPHQKALYGLGVAFAAYGLAVLQPEGNGFISVFVCAIVLGILRPDIRRCFESRSDDLIEIVKLGIFVVFGSLLTFGGLFGDGLAAVAIAAFVLFVARPAAVFAALLGNRDVDTPTKAFMAWFGPRGVATMTFSLLVLSEGIAEGERLFNLAALVVFCSILLHGLTDNAGTAWIARHAQRSEAAGREPSGGVPAA